MPVNGSLSELKQWHKVTLDFNASRFFSEANETTFRDYRLDVTFTHSSGTKLVVPGFFAADGDAVDSGATGGTVWRAHFTPPKMGNWTYKASFVTGDDVAIGKNLGSANGVEFNGAAGSFWIAKTDKGGTSDFRGKGMLVHDDGDRYLSFTGNGKSFIKGGAGSPENFLAYKEFDATWDLGGIYNNFLHAYVPHRQHAKAGDPTWGGQNGTGDEILGALNYLGSKGVNALYLLTMTRNGDGNDVWPWSTPDARKTFDVSKLDQWGVVFDHAQKLGIMIDLMTQEQENDQLLDGGALGVERMLYYRELVARFGHLNGVTWNLGEENTNTLAQRKAFAQHLQSLDPYDHAITLHTFPTMRDSVYGPLLGFKPLDGPSLQLGDGHAETLKWVNQSKAAGHPWVVAFDEFGGVGNGLRPDSVDPEHNFLRSEYLWGNMMAGGAGVDYYVGYNNYQDDLTIENFALFNNMWQQTAYAREFFYKYLPFDEMVSLDGLLPQNAGKGPAVVDDYALADTGRIYAIYVTSGGTTKLNLSAAPGTYDVDWFDPRNGGPLQNGTVGSVTGGKVVDLGKAPNNLAKDWAVLVRKIGPAQATLSLQQEGSSEAVSPAPSTVVLEATAELAGGQDAVDWGGGVQLKAVGSDGLAATLTYGESGFGIAGSRHFFQLDQDPTSGGSEAFLLDFDQPVDSLEVTLGAFFSGQEQETGRWRALDEAGQMVAEGAIDALHGSQLAGGDFTFAIATPLPFATLEIEATAQAGNSSDFGLRSLTVAAPDILIA